MIWTAHLEGKRASWRAMKGSNVGELWLIDAELKDADEIIIKPQEGEASGLMLEREKGATYRFAAGWDRRDGDPCEEEPGHIYIVANQREILPPAPETSTP